MTIRIPHEDSPTEVRQFCQQLEWHSRPLTDGAASGQLLVGAGVGVAPVWTDQSAIDHGGFGGLGDDDHAQYHNNTRGDARYYTETELDAGQLDNRYFTEAEHLDSSAGAGDAGKPIKLDADGTVDATMLNDADIDHGSIGGLNDDDHAQYHTDARGDARYYTETELDAGQLDTLYFGEDEYIASSAGAGDAGKPIVLDAAGHIDATMLNDGDVDHGSVGGLGDDDHTIYLLADGTRDLTGNLAVTAEITIDGRDLSEDGTKLDGIEPLADKTDATNVAAAGAAMSGGAFHDGFSDVGTDNHHAQSHTAQSHSDITSTGAQIETAVAASHAQSHNAASHSDIASSGTDIDDAVSKKHAESHSVASHSDTTATGAELETLTDNSIANTLHRHSELVASDGSPDPALAVDADGAITIGGSLGVTGNITGPNVTTGANPGHTHTGGVSGIDTVTELENNGSMHGAICHVVYSDGDGTFDFVDVSDPDKSNAIGLLTETITMGNTGFVRVGGVLSAAAGFWTAVGAGGSGLTPGAYYYASTTNAGWITDTRPTDPAYGIVRLGIALSTTDLSIDIQEAAPVLELLDTSATIYVDTAGNDSTGLGTSGAPFATLGKALSSLSTRVIASDVTMTIQLGDGTYTATSSDDINHPNGDRISIVGENVHSISLTSIQSSSGGAGAWAVIINVSDVSDAEVGDFLLVPRAVIGGSIPSALWGCWKITNVDAVNTRLTVATTSQYAVAPSGAVAGTVKIVKTVLQYNGCHGLVFGGGAKLGLLDKLVLAGNNTASTNGIHLSALNDCNAGNGNFGLSSFAYGAEIDFKSVLRFNSGIISSCARNVNIVDASLQGNSAVFSGASGYGLLLLQSSAVIQGAAITSNVNGLDAQTQSSVVFAGSGACYINTGTGLKASNNTFVFSTTSSVSSNGTNYSPTVNTLGNIESYIKG